MNIDFDKNIQKSLENYELPYDADAWSELSKKLDKTMPVIKKPNTKWWIISTIISVIAVSSIYFIQSDEKKEISSSSSSEKIDETQLSENSKTKEQLITINTKAKIIEDKQEHDNVSSNSNTSVKEGLKMKEIIEINSSEITILTNQTTHKENKYNKSIDDDKKPNPTVKIDNQQTTHTQNSIDFEIDNEFQYENGLPTLHLKATNFATNYEWDFEKLIFTPTTKEVEVHYFKKGVYNVKLSTTNSNGQIISETKKITVPEDYNLLAVDAFSPTENNIKTNTFIPFALTVRNVRFTMTIIDSKNGGILYQTSDANQPWDGIDKRTGVLVNASESFIWKVTLENPEQGESPIYKGVVIRL